MHRTISPLLVKAYKETIYVVEIETQEIKLCVGKLNNNLAKAMQLWNVSTAAFLTAFNPFSKITTPTENDRKLKELMEDVKPMCSKVFMGYGIDVEGKWPREDSFLALGISFEDAKLLASKYEQNAFVWISTNHGFVNLKLQYAISEPTDQELSDWTSKLPQHLKLALLKNHSQDLKWLMTIPLTEVEHWLLPHTWDLNKAWPIAAPDGNPFAVGTELDRMFKLTAYGMSKFYS